MHDPVGDRRQPVRMGGEPDGPLGTSTGDRAAHLGLGARVEMGDHSIFVGKVVDANVAKQPEGRADDATLWLKELGDKVFYGG